MFVKLLLLSFTALSVQATCKLSKNLKSEIHSYKEVVTRIKNAVVEDEAPLKNFTWTQLAEFVDKFGSRLSGTENLENSIDYLLDQLRNKHGLDNVHGEDALVPHWVRGEELAEIIKPRKLKLPILGLGGTIGTGPTGLTANIIVVQTFDELKNVSKNVPGKIVIFNEKYTTYGDTVRYRGSGASEAAKYGAVAVLIRTIAPFSISSPHTGSQTYKNANKIPTACITIEDAELLQRLYDRKEEVIIHLYMEAKQLPPVTSRNIISEIIGYEKPYEVILTSGHIDSWDVGQGAMDDGGGAFISWIGLVVLKHLDLRPKRTLRSVLWTAEEQGYVGASSYLKNHANELKNLSAVMESDEGTFTPTGLEFYGSEKAACILQEILMLMEPFNATILKKSSSPVGSDIALWQQLNVPGISLGNKNNKYFWFHHSEGDMMTVENPKDLDLCTALWTAVSYILADMSITLPRNTLYYSISGN